MGRRAKTAVTSLLLAPDFSEHGAVSWRDGDSSYSQSVEHEPFVQTQLLTDGQTMNSRLSTTEIDSDKQPKNLNIQRHAHIQLYVTVAGPRVVDFTRVTNDSVMNRSPTRGRVQ